MACVKTGILRHKLFHILRSQDEFILKLGQLIKYDIMEEILRKCALETSSRPLFNFGK